ncbi:MAG: hypothetical protein U0237_19850 [Thermoleophilia bacterium]
MQVRSRELFTTVRSEGALLPPELLQRVADGDRDLKGLAPTDYHLIEGETLGEAVNRPDPPCRCLVRVPSRAGRPSRERHGHHRHT